MTLGLRHLRGPVCGLCAVLVFCALCAAAAQQEPIARRVADRLAALRREADDLEKQEKSILTDLRRLEVERQITVEELAAIDKDRRAIEQQLAETTARAAALRDTAQSQQPDVEERLVRLYKMGRAGYWRLLLDLHDVRSMGRAYRTAAALAHVDRQRVHQHETTLAALQREQAALQARAKEVGALQARAAVARAALDKAVASRAALVQSIESRRELAAKLAAELDAAHLRLQAMLAQKPAGAPIAGIPIRPFKGELPWPADGIVMRRFGAHTSGRVSGISFNRNGIELSLAEGRPVTAIHEGTVTHAGPFTAYGQLVIIDHGGGAVSLYGQLSATDVNRGDRVGAGDRVGLAGRNPAGNPSLYFELRIDGQPVDPLQWLRRQP